MARAEIEPRQKTPKRHICNEKARRWVQEIEKHDLFGSDLHKALRLKAAETDKLMSDVVNDAVRILLAEG